LKAGATVTFLLRNPAVFERDAVIQEYVSSGKARLVKGDALGQEDCRKVWEVAAEGEPEGVVDVLIFTVGGIPSFSVTKGFVQNPHNLVTKCLLNVLCTLPTPYQTKIITISSTGLSKTSHATLPLLLKPLYGYLLTVPHNDKLGSERLVSHCAGWEWDEKDGGIGDDVMGAGWKETEGLPPAGALKDLAVVVRPALLTDGICVGDQEKKGKKKDQVGYRVQVGDLSGAWTISRKDVAHFLVEGVLKHWDDSYKGKFISIAY